MNCPSSLPPSTTRNLFCPPQVTTAQSVCGTWIVKPASRSSRPTERSSRSRSTTWRSTRPNATSPAPGRTLSPKCLYDVELRVSLQPRSPHDQGPTETREGKDRPAWFQSRLSPPAGFLSRLVDYVAASLKRGRDSPRRGSAGRPV